MNDLVRMKRKKTMSRWWMALGMAGLAMTVFFIGVRTRDRRPAPPLPLPAVPPREPSFSLTAFLLQRDAESVRSFREHAAEIDTVIPDWWLVTSEECRLREDRNADVERLLRSASSTRLVPRVSNGDGVWHIKTFQHILARDELRSCLARLIAERAAFLRVDGVNVDLEGTERDDQPMFRAFLADLAERLHAQRMMMSVDVPPYLRADDMRALGVIADEVIMMAYDQHVPESEPGPIASREWFTTQVASTTALLPSEHAVLGIANYAYDWNRAVARGESMTTPEAFSLARRNRSTGVAYDAVSGNPTFRYTDRRGSAHEVWLLNAETVRDELEIAARFGVERFSLWRLGSEDPDVWTIVKQKRSREASSEKGANAPKE